MNSIPDRPVTHQSEIFEDHRGFLKAFNTLDMHPVRRVYHIGFVNNTKIRAWQYHQKETKYFQCLNGEIKLVLLKLSISDNSRIEAEYHYVLEEGNSSVIMAPPGYANGIKAITQEAVLQVFSDMTLEESLKDDSRIDQKTFNINWNQ